MLFQYSDDLFIVEPRSFHSLSPSSKNRLTSKHVQFRGRGHSDRQVKDGDTWTTRTDWNTVAVLSEALRKRLANAKVGKKGNLMIFEGAIQTNAYEKDGEKIYSTSLIAQDVDVLSFAKDAD